MSTYGFARIFWSSCRESGGQLSLEQKNVLVNTEPTLKKKKMLKPLQDGKQDI